MRTVQNFLEAAQKIDILLQVQLSLVDSGDEYVKLQREQMLRGERSDGKPIFNLKTGSDEYSPGYAKYKGRKKPIDLYDTGAFQSDIFILVEDSEKAIVESYDSKSGKLQENYGEEIFTLNDESKVKFKPIAQSKLIERVQTELNK